MYTKPIVESVTIASGGTTSSVICARDATSYGLITPAALTSTAFTFTVCDTATGTFVTLMDSAGNTPSVTVTTSTGYAITGSEADALAPWAYFKLVGNSAEAAARTIKVCKK